MNQETLAMIEALGDNALTGFIIHEVAKLLPRLIILLMTGCAARAAWPTLKKCIEDQ